MEGFKKLAKGVKCFKEGGSVYKSRHSEKSEEKDDMAKDKKIVKKAFAMHDKQEHPGEKTNLSKLKKGGRAKKECGTVKKYKTGGTVENQYAAKKTDKDMKDIANTKRQKPKMLANGKSVKKYAPGGNVTDPQALVDKIAQQENADDASLLPRTARRIGRGMKRGMQGLGDMISGAPAPAPAADFGTESIDSLKKMGQGMGVTGQKKGGKVKKCAEGGSLKETDAEENPGLAKLPTDVRNKMGYMRKGGKAKKMMNGGTCS
jgi:hypothetical protein